MSSPFSVDIPISACLRRLLPAALIVFAAALFAQATGGAARAFAQDGDECTLFGACGYFVRGGGTLVLKNRDRNTRFVQSLVYEKPARGYAFLGVRNISPFEERTFSYTMGINEKGLVCVNSSAPKNIRYPEGSPRVHHVLQAGRILKDVASVDEFVDKYIRGGRLFGSMNYIIADKKKMLLLEMVDGRNYDYRIFVNGTAAHSNHYVSKRLAAFQAGPPGASSAKRLERALSLLERKPPFACADFMEFSRDHGASGVPGNDTVCRHPDGEYDARKFSGGTISSMIFRCEPGGRPAAYVALGQPCTTRYVKFEIEPGPFSSDPVVRELYRDGAVNIAWEVIRDVSFHLLRPFQSENQSSKKGLNGNAE